MENQALLWQQRRKEKALLIQVKAIKRKLAREAETRPKTEARKWKT